MKLIIQLLSTIIAGLIFGIGLIISQMANPQKVLNFLDITGNWDPSLAFVMGSALVVFVSFYHLVIKRMNQPLACEHFDLPKRTSIDKPLIAGAAIFGIGWGLAGICPGPAIVNITANITQIAIFIVCMAAGMLLAKKLS